MYKLALHGCDIWIVLHSVRFMQKKGHWKRIFFLVWWLWEETPIGSNKLQFLHLRKNLYKFKCERCHFEELKNVNWWKLYIFYYLHKYKLQIDVEDDIDYTSFVVFDREAENLLRIPTLYLLEKENGEHSGGPKIFKKIHGKRFVFQIRLNAYNLNDRFENCTINRIFVLD